MDGYWDLLRTGRVGVSRFTPAELLVAGVPAAQAAAPEYVPARGVIGRAEEFDWSYFGYSPAEAAQIDPQQRVLLECAAQALDDAGAGSDRGQRWTGVFAGGDISWPPPLAGDDPDAAAKRQLGYERDFLATRIAYKLGLRGPAITVQTACSTSLVAVHYASNALRDHECDVALAGGVTLRLPQTAGYRYQEGNILSPDGTCRPFDARAAGTVPSNGAGVVVLKRLSDAVADGDRVMALIRGTGVNNDGADKVGFTTPAVAGQREVIQLAQARAEVGATDISYVEAHGTGTAVGDPVEVAALAAAFTDDVGGKAAGSTGAGGDCWLGAVKANIGHTGAAAGVAGLIKVALMLQHRQLVPTPHLSEPNPRLRLAETPFRVCTTHRSWQASGPLVAGVSSFGVGGTNAHAILAEAPPAPAEPADAPSAVLVSARTAGALRELRQALAGRLGATESLRICDVAHTIATRRHHRYRTAVLADHRAQAVSRLAATVAPVAVAGSPRVAFTFPGQGALRGGHGRVAYERLPLVREVWDECAAQAAREYGVDLSPALRGTTDPAWYADPAHQQLGLFVLGYALAYQLREWGLAPVAMFGHSIGEYVAAAVAGVWSLPDALELVWRRGELTRAAPPGRMVALPITEQQAQPWLTDEVALAAIGHRHVVLSGPDAPVRQVYEAHRARGVPGRLLATARAYHSPQMTGVSGGLRQALSEVVAKPPRERLVSGLTGHWLAHGAAADPDYWVQQLRQPVRLAAAVDRLGETGAALVVELGPGESLTRQVRHATATGEVTAVSMLGSAPEQERHGLRRALARLWEHGVPVPWSVIANGERLRRQSLPAHPLAPTRPPAIAPARPAMPVAQASSPPAAALVARAHWPELDPPVRARPALAHALERYSRALFAQVLLDQAGLAAGDRVSDASLRHRLDPGRRFPRLVDHLLSVVAESGWLHRPSDGDWRVDPRIREISSALRAAEALAELAGLRRALARVAAQTPAVLAGQRSAVEVLYPEAAEDFLLDCLRDNQVRLDDSAPALAALRDIVHARCVQPGTAGLRVIEVGVGSGRLTWQLLTEWPQGSHVDYHVTDVSPVIVRRAQARAAELGLTGLRFGTFDLNRDLVAQGLPPGSYDLVLAYNAIHAATSVPAALGRVAALLRPGGQLAMVELTELPTWAHLLWGMAPGWWDFDDALRSRAINLDAQGWQEALRAAGLTDLAVVRESLAADHLVVVAGPGEPIDAGAQPAPDAGPVPRRPPVPAVPALTGARSVASDGPVAPEATVVAERVPASASSGGLAERLAAIWCEELGVGRAEPDDDFYGLGGESLMIVHLLARVRRECGVRIPTGEAAGRFTFADLLARVTSEAAGQTGPTTASAAAASRQQVVPAGVTVLAATGDRRPLFLIAPATGSSLCYRHLARRLGDRPVYGIDAPGLDGSAPPLADLGELAAHHVEVLRSLAPTGPYLLGGWSFGAMVGHEMVRLLAADGEPPCLLLGIDGYLPDTGGRPVATKPAWLARSLGFQLRARLGSVRGLPRGERPATQQGRVARVSEVARAAGSGAPGYVRTHNAAITAMLRHRPAPIDCDMVVLKAGASPAACARLHRRLRGLYRGRLLIRPALGDHWQVLDERHADALAIEIQRVLDEWEW